MPGLFAPLRGLIDGARRRGLRTGRYLLLGSAALSLLRQAGESLAGRVRFLELAPSTRWRRARFRSIGFGCAADSPRACSPQTTSAACAGARI
ncbi:MAG: hypothetical protein N3C12_05615 [Candidatus Binatia bacterium]|nr:hypothetical protein [Candidatus Binatia bacterium]